MTINSMTQNSMLNSYFNINNFQNKNTTKKANTIGFDYASNNQRMLDRIIEKRTAYETDFSQKLHEFRTTSKDFYQGFYSKIGELSSAASKLKTTSMDSTLRPMGYSSNNGEVVTGVSGSLDSGKSLDVNVSQIASGQKTTFSDLSATGKGDLAGKSTLNIAVGGKKVAINVEISEKVTNEQALKEIVDKVNSAKAGVTASVEVKNGRAQFSLFDDKTGEKSSFTASVEGKAKSILGEGSVTAGVNAKYTVDGKEFTSETNSIKLADGKLSATIAGTGTANISKNNFDTTNAVNAMQDFAAKYNNALDYLNKNAGISSNIKNLASSFGDTKYISSALNKVGISTDSAGRLSVDNKKFSEALQKSPDTVNKIIGSAGGLAGTTAQKASAAIANSRSLIQPPRNFNGFYGTSIGMMMDYRA